MTYGGSGSGYRAPLPGYPNGAPQQVMENGARSADTIGAGFASQDSYSQGEYTVDGVMRKVAAMFGLLGVSAALGVLTYLVAPSVALGVSTVCCVVLFGLVVYLIVSAVRSFFTKRQPNYRSSKWASILYAGAMGWPLAIGILELSEKQGMGPVLSAVMVTVVVTVVSWVAVSTGVVKPGRKFRSVAVIGFVSVMSMYLVNFVLSLTPVGGFLDFGSGVSVLVSVVVLVIAVMNIVVEIDDMFDFAAHGAPKGAEWVTTFNLVMLIVLVFREALNISSWLGDWI